MFGADAVTGRHPELSAADEREARRSQIVHSFVMIKSPSPYTLGRFFRCIIIID